MSLQFLGTNLPAYGNGFSAGVEFIGAGLIGALVFVYLLTALLSVGLSVTMYVLRSLGLHTIAKRRGIRHGWLAWIPFGRFWVLGSISDQYQYVVKGKVKNRRKIMLAMSIAITGLCLLWIPAAAIITMVGGGTAATPVLTALLGVFAILALDIWLTVYQYISYYDLFHSCQPGNGILYLVLSIVVPATMPFFVFFCRKKDLGMPPRKQTPVQVEPVAEEDGFAQPEEFVEAEQTEEAE